MRTLPPMKNLRKLRKQRGLSQAQLARKVRTGQAAISFWETGEREPKEETVKRVAKALGVSVGALR